MTRLAFASHARVPAGAEDPHEPMSAMNTTPLIDVMLVLLIMVILTVPLTTDKIPLDLPQPGKAEASVTHQLFLTREGRAMLDGMAVDEPALAARLRTIAVTGDTLTMRTDPEARYDRFAETLATVKRSGVTRLGFTSVAAE